MTEAALHSEQQAQLATQELLKGNLAGAELMFRHLISSGTAGHAVYGNLAAILQSTNRPDEVEGLLLKALEIQPSYPEAHNNLANLYQKRGELEKAVQRYGQAIALRPDFEQAHDNCGVVLRQLNRRDEALVHHQDAVRLKPDNINYLFNLATVQLELGQTEEAVVTLHSLEKISPSNHRALNNLGVALLRLQRTTEALEVLRRAVGLVPNYADALNNLGNTLVALKDSAAAEAAFAAALANEPTHNGALLSLAGLKREQKKYADAIDLLERAVDLRPNSAELINSLGVSLQLSGDLEAARRRYEQALRLDPNSCGAHYNLANNRRDAGDPDVALRHYQKAIALNPSFRDAYNNYGLVLQSEGRLQEAIKAYEQCLECDSQYLEAINNLANCRRDFGDFQGALKTFQLGLAIDPDYPELHWNRSMVLLLVEDFEQGWPEYEYRWRKQVPLVPLVRPPLPLLPDSISVEDPTAQQHPDRVAELVLVAEQGLGDQLQFMRYGHLAHALAERVTLCLPDKLVELARHSRVADEVLGPTALIQAPGQRHWLPLMSLLSRLNVTNERTWTSSPFLSVPSDRIDHWRQKLRHSLPVGQKLVVINWQGNPNTETSNLRGRSMSLETLAPLAHCPGVTLLSMQRGHGSEQLETCSFQSHLHPLQSEINEIWDLVETAAILQACDLVISTDTAMVHLSAAVGQQTWALLHHLPDWRWGANRDGTRWYDTMRVFRQQTPGDWHAVIDQLVLELGGTPLSASSMSSASAAPSLHPGQVNVPVGFGELIDKLTILEIKQVHLHGSALENVEREFELLSAEVERSGLRCSAALRDQLKSVNEDLWKIEDDIRLKEREQAFDDDFIALARAVYRTNDERARLKRHINDEVGSLIVEEKSYADWQAPGSL
jgi:tetratricopeptide (TPR) repeat protein